MDQSDEEGSISRRNLMRAAAGATAAAATASAASGNAAAQEDDGGSSGTSHTVEMTDGLVYDPAEITIAPGDTVVWDNVGSLGHSVTAYEEDLPEGASYWASGGFDSESAAREGYPQQGDIPGGETWEYTFETTGEYPYFCIPHEAAGMVGTVVVEEPSQGGEDAGPALPQTAKTVLIATVAAMGSTLALAYFFLKYGGSRQPQPE